MPPIEEAHPAVRDAVERRGRSWEAYSLIIATAVGLLSLAVSAYTAYTLHLQTRAQVYPYMQVVALPEQLRFGVHNKGVGPAFVRSVGVVMDGKPVSDWKQFFAAAGVTLKAPFASSNVNHAAIAANETLNALIFRDVDDFRAFGAIDPRRYRIDLCYCSVLDECWTFHAAGDEELPEPRRIASCPVDRATDFTQ